MKNFKWFLIFSGFLILIGCRQTGNLPEELQKEYPESISFSVNNQSNQLSGESSVYLSIKDIETKNMQFNSHAFLIWSGDKEIPSQAIDTDADGEFDTIIFNINLGINEKKDLIIRYNPEGENVRKYQKRTQAELSRKFGGEFIDRKYVGGEFKNVSNLKVPPEHTDHSEFIRYEGPGWESDKVGYRFYLDWRNAIDIFGKKVSDMVLQNAGQDGFESYHHPSEWGMDILKVGESLGVGSIAMWEDGRANRVAVTDSVDCSIVANGALYSQIRTRYFGWKIGSGRYDLISDLSITAGSRITKNQIHIEGEANNLCSGLAKYPDTEYFQSETSQGEWGYMALYGKQSLAEDNLGTAVIYPTKQLLEISEDELNYVVVLQPDQKQIGYYFLAAWEQEPGGIKSVSEFKVYLDRVIMRLNEPLVVQY